VTERVKELLAAVEERLRALERVARETTAAGWVRRCKAEGWPVALVAYHIARGLDRQASFIEEAVAGRGPHLYSWDETHALNARIAGEHAMPTAEEVLATAHAAVARIRSIVVDFRDEDLRRVAFVNGSFQGTLEWLLRVLVPQHADGHLASIASALVD
jgi:hypothetical protein